MPVHLVRQVHRDQLPRYVLAAACGGSLPISQFSPSKRAQRRVYSLSLSDIVLTIPNLVRSHVIYRPTSNSAISAASSKPAPTERAAASVSHSPTTEAPTPMAQQDSVETLPLPNPPFTTASSTLMPRPCRATMGITLLILLRKFLFSSPLPSSPLYTERYHPFHSMSFYSILLHSISFHPHLFTALTIDAIDKRVEEA